MILDREVAQSQEEEGICIWRVLDEKDVIEIPELGFERVKENEIMMPHPLKEHLGVGCVSTHYFYVYRV
jgi:hypothetical protein